jgi:hypothetical protein
MSTGERRPQNYHEKRAASDLHLVLDDFAPQNDRKKPTPVRSRGAVCQGGRAGTEETRRGVEWIHFAVRHEKMGSPAAKFLFAPGVTELMHLHSRRYRDERYHKLRPETG